MLDIHTLQHTIQTPILERFDILKKQRAWFFTRVHFHESLVFSKVWTWIWFGRAEGAWKICHSEC